MLEHIKEVPEGTCSILAFLKNPPGVVKREDSRVPHQAQDVDLHPGLIIRIQLQILDLPARESKGGVRAETNNLLRWEGEPPHGPPVRG